MENQLRSILDVGKRDDGLAAEAFSRSKIYTVIDAFPKVIKMRFLKCPGQGGARLEAILEKISELRKETQDLQAVKEAASDAIGGISGSIDNNGSRGSTGGGKNGSLSLQVFNPPRKHNSCRICVTLETEGDTSELYDNHIHSYPTVRDT